MPALKAHQLRSQRAIITPNLTLMEDGRSRMMNGYAG
jgi:hypothetical protein